MTTKPADAVLNSPHAMDAAFEETVRQVKKEWGQFWTYMAVFGCLVMLVIIFSR